MKKYQGTITIIGKPNVGKSSLLNTIFEDKISIVNQKPQTTRNKIASIFVDNLYHLEFVDTPGFHNEKNKLDTFLNDEVKLAIKNSDLIYFLCDGSRPLNNEDFELLNLVKHTKVPVFLVITKSDISHQGDINNISSELKNEFNFVNTVLVSTHDLKSIDNLLYQSQKYLTFAEEVVEDEIQTIQKDLFLVKEIIREQCLLLLRQEIPYGVAILIEDFKYDKNKNEFYINASLNVEKESQKKILIGTKGAMIKQISMNARKELLKIYDAKIYLKLFVKVEKNWRDNDLKLKEFGYSH